MRNLINIRANDEYEIDTERFKARYINNFIGEYEQTLKVSVFWFYAKQHKKLLNYIKNSDKLTNARINTFMSLKKCIENDFIVYVDIIEV